MKYTLYFVAFAFAVCCLDCQHSAKQITQHAVTQTKPAAPLVSMVDMIAGTRIWHGIYQFDNITYPITNDTITITVVDDSTIQSSSLFSPLTYYQTDSLVGYAIFIFKWAPPTLYYYYNGDSMHYSRNDGGIHNENWDLYTP